MREAWYAFLFFLPAGIANISPVFINKLPLLNQWEAPLDFGKTYHGQRIFGANKRWRGLIGGTLVGALAAVVVSLTFPDAISYFKGTSSAPLLTMAIIGAALGFGALVGDTIESFFKRQARVSPGNSWFPFDQLDYIIGGLVSVWPFVHLKLNTVVYILAIYFGLHLIFSYLGFLLRLKPKPI